MKVVHFYDLLFVWFIYLFDNKSMKSENYKRRLGPQFESFSLEFWLQTQILSLILSYFWQNSKNIQNWTSFLTCSSYNVRVNQCIRLQSLLRIQVLIARSTIRQTQNFTWHFVFTKLFIYLLQRWCKMVKMVKFWDTCKLSSVWYNLRYLKIFFQHSS